MKNLFTFTFILLFSCVIYGQTGVYHFESTYLTTTNTPKTHTSKSGFVVLDKYTVRLYERGDEHCYDYDEIKQVTLYQEVTEDFIIYWISKEEYFVWELGQVSYIRKLGKIWVKEELNQN